MAIQMRRGEYSKFDPSKLLPGEVAVVMSGDTTTASGRGVYVCVSAGTVVRVPTVDDAVAMIADAYPEAKVTRYSGYAMLEVTAPDGTKTTARVNDGVSPTVAVTPIEGGNDVAITDASGTKTVRIMNGISAPRSLANLLTRSLPEASSQTVDDAAKTPLVGATVYGKSTQDGTPTPDAPVAIESVVAPNLIDLSSMPASSTSNGITFKPVFKDGLVQYVTLSGTSTDRAKSVEVPLGRLPDGTYTFSLDNRVQNVGAYVRIVQSGSSTRYIDLADGNVGERSTFTVSGENNTVLMFDVRVGGVTLNDHRIRPVLNAGSIAYPYTPYGTMGLLTVGRNLWKMNRSMTVGGVTFTVAADGTVTMNGTATSTLNIEKVLVVPKTGTYRLSGCPSGGGASSYQLWTTNLLSTGQDHGITDTGSGGTGTLTEGNYIALRLRVQGGYTCNNVVVRPMLEVGATAHAYEPYKESMTVLPLDGHVLRSLPDGTRDEVTVDQYGHVTLVQRVGSDVMTQVNRARTDANGKSAWSFNSTQWITGLASNVTPAILCDNYTREKRDNTLGVNKNDNTICVLPVAGTSGTGQAFAVYDPNISTATVEEANAYFAAHPFTVQYALTNPVTHDLGTVDPTALCGPDMTAQAVPTAHFALTYERDLNTTLARLEAAIADAATA